MDDLEQMVSDGSLDFAGLSQTGEPLYTVNDKCKELHPEFWQSQFSQFQNDLYSLWNDGYLDVDIANESAQDQIVLTSKAFDPAPDLDSRLKSVLEEIVRVISVESGTWDGD
jgi:hypothetical protein